MGGAGQAQHRDAARTGRAGHPTDAAGRGGDGRLRPLTSTDLTRFDVGRRQREVSPALRQLLGTIDGERCRFPGCTRHRKLHAHHVVYWSRQGLTDLANPEGTRLLHHPAQPWGEAEELDPARGVSAGSLSPGGYDRLDLGDVVSVLMQQAA